MVQKFQINFFLIVLVLLQNSLFIAADCDHDSRYPHTGNCEHFYQCYYGTLYELSCADGLHFDAKTEICDLPEIANCEIEPKCDDGDILPHADQCELFYKCSEGSLHVYTCPDELHFNPIEKICDWPEEAKCEITEEKCVDGDLTPNSEDCQLFFKCSNGSLEVISCPDGLHFDPIEKICEWPEEAKCEITEDKCVDGDLTPNPEDCQLFFKCSGGSLEVISCPDGLHFDPTEKICEWPEEAKCEITEDKCVDGDLTPNPEDCQLFFKCSGGSLEVISCPDGLHFDPIEKICEWPEEAKCEITEEKCVDGDLFPDEESCARFYKCTDATLELQSCPEGLHFNPIEKYCDWPEAAKCEISEEKCVDGDLFPHGESCERFYQCSGGSLHLQSCPEGLHFSAIDQLCEFPEQAQCDILEEKCVDGDIFPHSEACDLFVLCSQGKLHVLSCPEGLHFDSNEKRCDDPENVICEVK